MTTAANSAWPSMPSSTDAMNHAASGCPRFFSSDDTRIARLGAVPLRSTVVPCSPMPNASSAMGTAAWPRRPMGEDRTVGKPFGSAPAARPRAAPTKIGFRSGVISVRRMSSLPCRDVSTSRMVRQIGA